MQISDLAENRGQATARLRNQINELASTVIETVSDTIPTVKDITGRIYTTSTKT
jgi:hypothetical protein